ncbi:hypothetical protein R1CP_37675 (plasmid) [Rhodococcus opacus]|uniref:Uncharacterized protein n=1 Tax=Rhodococcus opacus TaxID=37919 RepID=A0A1B1KHQ1_RHOOP|nr:hypothetical protein R1CP_37675 [Rhodococcus opacus]
MSSPLIHAAMWFANLITSSRRVAASMSRIPTMIAVARASARLVVMAAGAYDGPSPAAH